MLFIFLKKAATNRKNIQHFPGEILYVTDLFEYVVLSKKVSIICFCKTQKRMGFVVSAIDRIVVL